METPTKSMRTSETGSPKTIKVAAMVTLLILLGLTTYRFIQFSKPQSIQGSLLARFAGITNGSGEILVFLTNCSRWQMTYYPRIEIKESGLWPTLPANIAFDDVAKPRTIPPFTNEPVALAPPTNALEWRLWIVYVAATERNQKVQKAQNFFESIGLSSIGYRIKWDEVGMLFLPESKDP